MHRKLIVINGLAIIGVVVNHAIAWGFVAMFWWTHRYSDLVPPNFEQLFSPAYFSLRAVEQLIIFSIPAFLLVSGYFISATTKSDEGRPSFKLVFTRIRTLVIPYVIWSVLLVCLELLQGEVYTAAKLGRTLLLGQATPAFYFVPLLVQLYFLSPVLLPLVRANSASVLAITAALQIVAHLAVYAQILPGNQVLLEGLGLITPGWFFPGNIFWFVLGMYVGLNRRRVLDFLARLRGVLIAASIMLFPLGLAEWEWLLQQSPDAWLTPKETFVDNIFSVILLMTLLANLGPDFPQMGRISRLGTKSYGIYLTHSLVLTVTARAVYHLVPNLLAVQWLFVLLLIIVGVLIPLFLMEIVKRSPFSWAYTYLFG